MSKMAAFLGLGVMVGPTLGGLVASKSGNPKYTALFAVFASLAQAAFIYNSFEESLDTEKRKKGVDWASCSPFTFLQMFSKTAKMRALSFLNIAQSVPVDMHDVRMVLLKTKIGMTTDQVSVYMLGNGLSAMVSGAVGAKLYAALGGTVQTTVSHAFSIAEFFLWAWAGSVGAVGSALALGVVGGQKGISTNARLTIEGANAGMGKGQVAASIAQMSNVCKIVFPFTFASLFARYGQATPFYLAAASMVLSEWLQRAVPQN